MSPGYTSSSPFAIAATSASAVSVVDIFGIERCAVSRVSTAPGMKAHTVVP